MNAVGVLDDLIVSCLMVGVVVLCVVAVQINSEDRKDRKDRKDRDE